jgi:hypothetical protein
MDAVRLICAAILRAFGPPRVRLPFYIIVVEVFARLPISSPCPLRGLSVDWANILMAIAARDADHDQQ